MAKGSKKNNCWVADPAIRTALARELRCARLRREIRFKRMARMQNAPQWMREMSREEAQSLFLAECRTLYMAFEAADAAVAARQKDFARVYVRHHAEQIPILRAN